MSTLMKERDQAFYDAYRKAWDKGARTHAEAVTMALESPTPRLWVSERYLYLKLLAMRLSRHSPTKRSGLYERLYERYMELRERKMGRRLTDAYIVRMLVYQPAKGFPFGRRTAERIIKRMRKRFRDLAI